MRERERLIARIRQLRREGRTADGPTNPPSANPEPEHSQTLEARVEHLEALVQGLQDSVHRSSSRHDRMIAELEARIQPAAMGKALNDDARARGL